MIRDTSRYDERVIAARQVYLLRAVITLDQPLLTYARVA